MAVVNTNTCSVLTDYQLVAMTKPENVPRVVLSIRNSRFLNRILRMCTFKLICLSSNSQKLFSQHRPPIASKLLKLSFTLRRFPVPAVGYIRLDEL